MSLIRHGLAKAGLLVIFSLTWAGCQKAVEPAKDASAGSEDTSGATDSTAHADPTKASAARRHSRIAPPEVAIATSLGEIVLRLDMEHSPRTVINFLNYVDGGHYDSTIFHQVVPGYVAIGGAFSADLVEKPGRYPIPNEATNGLKNLRGTISMARSADDAHSSTCQFFINLADNPDLDHAGDSVDKFGYCVFGKVIRGTEVLDKFGQVRVQDKEGFESLPVRTVLIETARRLR